MPNSGDHPLPDVKPWSDECRLQTQGLPCACGRLRPGCVHFVQGRVRRMVVTLAEGMAAARALELAVAVRAMEGVTHVRFR